MGFFDGLKNFFSSPKVDEVENGSLVVDIDSQQETSVTVDELIAEIKGELERRRGERAGMELQWLLNSNFVAGHQYCEINPSAGEVREIERENDSEERGVYNRIAPIYDTRMAHLRNVRYAMTVRPATAEDDDIEKAAVSTDLLRYTQRKLNFEELKARIYDWSELLGTAFVMSWWDGKGGKAVLGENGLPVIGADGEELHEGDIACGLLTPYEIFPESVYKETVGEQRSIIVDQVLHISEIYERYGLRVDGQECDKYVITPISGAGGYGLSTFQSTVMATKTTRVHDSAHCITYFEKPTKKYPTGRVAVIVADRLVHYGGMPYDEIPIIAIKCKSVAGQFFGKSYVQDLIPLQRAYNGCKNAIHNYIKAASNEPLLVPKGAVEELDEIAEYGLASNQIIEYRGENGRPSYLTRSGIPNDVWNEMQNLITDMEYTAGISQMQIYGSAPSGVKSGTAIAQLRDIDNTRLSLTAENMREGIRQLAIRWLHIYKTFCTTNRVAEIMGINNIGSVFVWSADDINSYDVVYDTVNELVLSEDQQRENFLQALQMGLFADDRGVTPREFREKAIEMMRLGNFTQLMTLSDQQRANAKRENDFLMAGVIPEVYRYDDHEIHIAEHVRFALQYRFKRFRGSSPALAEAFDRHIEDHRAHLQAMAQQNQQAAMMAAALNNRMTSEGQPSGQK